MSRTISSALVAELQQEAKEVIGLAKFEFDEGDVGYWTGLGTLTYDGLDYVGTGQLLSMTNITESASIKATGMQFRLSGLPSAILSLSDSSDYQNRPATLYIAAIDINARTLVGTPLKILAGRMDTMDQEESGESAALVLSIENILVTLETPNVRRYTPEDQLIEYAGDEFFNDVNTIQNLQIVWGRG